MTRSHVATRSHKVLVLSLVIIVAAPLFACGVGSIGAASASLKSKAPMASTCHRISDVLSDGPDPSVDPVGYALAQVLPLREIKTSVSALHMAIVGLASSYEKLYKTNDKKGTEKNVNKAGKKVNRICPGAFDASAND
jgi:hypothetical protein